MKERIFDGRLAERAAGGDKNRRDRLKAIARALVGVVRDGLIRDGFVRIHGFGSFRLKPTSARTGYNPHTGQQITIPARHRVLFRPAKALRERIDPGDTRAVVLAEPHPSREATLGGVMTGASAAGALQSGNELRDDASLLPAASAQPERVPIAAAAIADPTIRSSAAPERTAVDDQRPSATDTGSVVAETGEAANAEELRGGGAPPEAGPPLEPEEPEEKGRPRDRLIVLLLLLVLVLGALLWWLWPAPRTEPPIATVEPDLVVPADPQVPGTTADDPVAAEAPPAVVEDAPPAVATEPEAADPDVPPIVTDPLITEPDLPTTLAEAAADAPAAEVEPATDQPPVDEAAMAEAPDAAATEAPATVTDTAATVAEPWFVEREHAVVAGDTLWGLSDRHYVNPFYWPHIYNHNRDGLDNPDRLEIDQRVLLPPLEGDPQALTAADRQSIAEGYLRLYRFWNREGYANADYALVGVRHFDASVMPADLAVDAGYPRDTMAAIFAAQLAAQFGD